MAQNSRDAVGDMPVSLVASSVSDNAIDRALCHPKLGICYGRSKNLARFSCRMTSAMTSIIFRKVPDSNIVRRNTLIGTVFMNEG